MLAYGLMAVGFVLVIKGADLFVGGASCWPNGSGSPTWP